MIIIKKLNHERKKLYIYKPHRITRECLRSTQMCQKRDYDLRKLNEIVYSPADLVWKLYQVRKKGRSFKLESPKKGPFLVIKAQPPLYHLLDQRGKSVIHHDNLSFRLNSKLGETQTR